MSGGDGYATSLVETARLRLLDLRFLRAGASRRHARVRSRVTIAVPAVTKGGLCVTFGHITG